MNYVNTFLKDLPEIGYVNAIDLLYKKQVEGCELLTFGESSDCSYCEFSFKHTSYNNDVNIYYVEVRVLGSGYTYSHRKESQVAA